MILIDTSVWIEYFKQNVTFLDAIKPLLSSKRIITIEPVFSELLYGVRNRKEKEIIQSYWEVLPQIAFGSNSMIEASNFANSNKYFQLGVGLIDAVIIKAAIDGNHLLWTLDTHIHNRIDQKLQFHPSNRD